MRAEGAHEVAKNAAGDADRAEAEAWSIEMEAYGGPAQPSPTSLSGYRRNILTVFPSVRLPTL
jgi:hypothetical protein